MNEDQSILDDLCRRAGELIAATRGPLKSVRVRAGEMSVEVEWPEAPPAAGAVPAQGAAAVAISAAAVPVAEEEEPAGVEVTAPLVGTFYRAPSPDAPPFVEVGDMVEAGRQVAIVEAMKLMNAVTAERSGRVARVLVEDGKPVEYGQPLFLLAPEETGEAPA
ncbi:acetyl-CoA carboxylase biotin carboxyl carrier protein [Actinomadura roseirufa]|uniref:acetyl-CoA carboxylase biotin carboxyl carrier protein n=1 Tax=Actinomadura roseirufa TaxID=2094049 RepID=UPI0013F17A00|nr:acetyl-CoA carboxylase biotin carboxyl carrier protein [Actinomadura roseirufa]